MAEAIKITNLKRKTNEISLDIPQLQIPGGCITAITGKSGAGKTLLLKTLAGISLGYEGEITFFDQYTDMERENKSCPLRDQVGYVELSHYFPVNWTYQQVGEASEMLFRTFKRNRFDKLCDELQVTKDTRTFFAKKLADYSDGDRVKIAFSAVLARDTRLLLLDEPMAHFDSGMRQVLRALLKDYIKEGNGQNSVIYTAGYLTDMEEITDYEILLEQGKVVKNGYLKDMEN
ncbi:MAG: ATP-binding cassette domain-containing protein [Lachnospiraceae bacterium]|nr:ATP-binding cassette domain-containing protein [Lachnospiraceae bacterium]